MGSLEIQEKINSAVDKMKRLQVSIGNSIAELLSERIRDGKATAKNIESDLDRMVGNLPVETRERVYRQALIALASTMTTGRTNGYTSQNTRRRNSADDGDRRSSLFGF